MAEIDHQNELDENAFAIITDGKDLPIFKTRERFSNFMDDLQIEEMVDMVIRNIEKFEDTVLLKYGGNAWRENFSRIPLTGLQDICTISGNYDVVAFMDEPRQEHLDFCTQNIEFLYEFIKARFNYLCECVSQETITEYLATQHRKDKTKLKNDKIGIKPFPWNHWYQTFQQKFGIPGMVLDEDAGRIEKACSGKRHYILGDLKKDKKGDIFSPNYKISFVVDTEAGDGTIVYGYKYHIMLVRKFSDLKDDINLLVPDTESRSIFYFEFGATPVRTDLIEDFFVGNNNYVNKFGLYFITSLMTRDRTKEKGLSIDKVREDMLKPFLPDIFSNFNSLWNESWDEYWVEETDFGPKTDETIERGIFFNLYNQIFTKRMDQSLILRTKPEKRLIKYFYRGQQRDVIEKLFAKYSCRVEPDNSGISIPYEEYLARLNDQIIDNNGGANDPNFPSFRLLMNLFTTIYDTTITRARLESSGGDSFRHYLPEDIHHTADLDYKLFYYKKYDKNRFNDLIILLCVFMTFYMENNHYFRFAIGSNVTFGNKKVRLEYDSRRQERILSCRYLPFFIVPLISVDVKIKSKIIIDEIPVSGYFKNGVLDIGFNKLTEEKFLEKKTVRTIEVGEQKKIEMNWNPLIPLADQVSGIITGNTITLAPLPSLDYLKEDINELINVDVIKRAIAGKDKKDKHRLKLLLNLEARIKNGKIEKDKRRYKLLGELEKDIHKTGEDPTLQNYVITHLEQIQKRSDVFIANQRHFIETIRELLRFGNFVFPEDSLLSFDRLIPVLNIGVGRDGNSDEGKIIIVLAKYLAHRSSLLKRKIPFSSDLIIKLVNENMAKLQDVSKIVHKKHETRKLITVAKTKGSPNVGLGVRITKRRKGRKPRTKKR